MRSGVGRRASLSANDAAARFSIFGALDELCARVEQGEIVYCCRVGRIELERGLEFAARLIQVSTQHIRVSFVIKHARIASDKPGCFGVAKVRQVKPAQSIVACRQSHPSSGVLWSRFDRVLEVMLR